MKESVKSILHSARQTVGVTVILMLVCGLLFPCLLTGLSALIFPHQADGNLLTVNGQTVGAEYVGQEFTEDYYMWSRPSAYHYNVYVEGEDGHLIKLKCEADVDIDGIQLVNQVGQPQFFQMSFRYNRLTGEGSVTGLESTGDFSIELTDTSLDEGEGPLFGLYMVYRTSENYYPNPYGEGYLCDYICWVYTNLGPFDSRDILRVEDCVTATPWDADGDGIDELVVRTRWPEKPYSVYDMVDGEVQAVSWPDTVPEEIRENLTCIWEQ